MRRGRLETAWFTSIDLVDVARLPALVDRWFGWTVEAQDREIAPARYGCQPVAFLAIGRLRPEI